MQMSRERFQEVHKLIWNTVISHAEYVKKGTVTVRFLKRLGVNTAYERGLLDLDEVDMLEYNNCCLLCLSCGYCETCPLKSCDTYESLYYRSCKGDKEAMIEIRDIVDKEPFTDLSVITLYMNARR